VLDYLDLERPAISPLLIRAVTAHGGGLVPAIKDRNAIPLQSMHLWIEQTIAKNPQLKDYHAARKPAPAKTMGESNFAAPPDQEKKAPTPVSRGVAQTEAPLPKAAARPDPFDMYDPIHFNRWAHPQR
jgi:hypothetical protein